MAEKWDPKACQGVFAGYSMKSSYEWDGYYKVWDLAVFTNCDLRACSTHKQQNVGNPQVVARCELPVGEGLVFP